MKKIPLYRQIQEDIKQQIKYGSLKPGDRLPSEMDFARKYFVSQITSKNALNGLVDEGYVVRIQGKGSFVANNLPEIKGSIPYEGFQVATKGMIGLLMPAMVTKVSQKLLNYIEKFTSESNYQLMLHITRESITDEALSIATMRMLGVKGLLIFPAIDELYNEAILRLAIERFPLVLIDRYLKNISVCSVTSDNYQGMYNATKYLVESGHKKISLVSPKNTNSAVEDRILGHEAYFYDNCLPIEKNNWCILDYDINETEEAFQSIVSFYQTHPEITAIICINSEMAQLTYYALQSINLKIPEDCELISFDQPYIPNVSYVSQNEKEIARKAVDLLYSQIEGIADNKQVKVETSFVNYKKIDNCSRQYHLLYVLNSGTFST